MSTFSDTLVLRDVRLHSSPPLWSLGHRSTLSFKSSVTCAAADCSTKTGSRQNFDFRFFFFFDSSVDGDEEELTVIGALSYLSVDSDQSDLR